MGFDFSTLTPEAREAARVKGIAARAAASATRIANRASLKLNYKDEAHWDDLARKHGVTRMPMKDAAVDTTCIRKWCNRLDIPMEVFAAYYTSAAHFVKNNPTWTQYATAGILLELKDELETV